MVLLRLRRPVCIFASQTCSCCRLPLFSLERLTWDRPLRWRRRHSGAAYDVVKIVFIWTEVPSNWNEYIRHRSNIAGSNVIVHVRNVSWTSVLVSCFASQHPCLVHDNMKGQRMWRTTLGSEYRPIYTCIAYVGCGLIEATTTRSSCSLSALLTERTILIKISV